MQSTKGIMEGGVCPEEKTRKDVVEEMAFDWASKDEKERNSRQGKSPSRGKEVGKSEARPH